jgi:hypothetical protein
MRERSIHVTWYWYTFSVCNAAKEYYEMLDGKVSTHVVFQEGHQCTSSRESLAYKLPLPYITTHRNMQRTDVDDNRYFFKVKLSRKLDNRYSKRS